VTSTELADLPRHRLVVDREKAAMAGVTEAEVGLALRRLIDGEELAVAHMPGERVPVPIRLMTPRRHEVDTAMLQSVKVTNRAGLQVPLVNLVRVSADLEDRPILHKDGERVAYVGGELGSTVPVYAVIDLDRRLAGLPLPDGTRLATGNAGLRAETPQTLSGMRLLWDGELRMTIDAYRDMGLALAGAVALVFLILVAYYKSFALALVAMASIPLCIVGVFPGHWLLGAPFSGTSMIGVIALAGVVVRNSLLIVDFVLDYLRQGMSLEAAVIEASAVRLRPILLTALAIVFGSLIMLSDPVFGGLAISLIFGTLASTVLTMVVIPVLLLFVGRRQPLLAAQARPAMEAS
jgi:multidrug efflux pump subunit AcrB